MVTSSVLSQLSLCIVNIVDSITWCLSSLTTVITFVTCHPWQLVSDTFDPFLCFSPFTLPYACRTYVCPSVTLWWVVTPCNKKWNWADDRIDQCLDYLHTEVDPNRNILWSRILFRNTSGYGKMWFLHFSGNKMHIKQLTRHFMSHHLPSFLFGLSLSLGLHNSCIFTESPCLHKPLPHHDLHALL